MRVAIHTHVGLLHEILRPFPVTHRPIDTVHQASVVAIDELTEGTLLTIEKLLDHLAVVQGAQLASVLPDRAARGIGCGLSLRGKHGEPPLPESSSAPPSGERGRSCPPLPD
jgi:hypothetical protein